MSVGLHSCIECPSDCYSIGRRSCVVDCCGRHLSSFPLFRIIHRCQRWCGPPRCNTVSTIVFGDDLPQHPAISAPLLSMQAYVPPMFSISKCALARRFYAMHTIAQRLHIVEMRVYTPRSIVWPPPLLLTIVTPSRRYKTSPCMAFVEQSA